MLLCYTYREVTQRARPPLGLIKLLHSAHLEREQWQNMLMSTK
jgi:hypothetical protein